MDQLTAIILCGGKGERLRPITETIPKALVDVRGLPFLLYLLNYLAAVGVCKFVLCVGYRAEMFDEFAARYCKPEWSVSCVNSGDASMTDRIADARSHFSGPALICYGDTFADVDLQALLGTHQKGGSAATICVYPLKSSFGIVEFNSKSLVTNIMEKPILPYWVNIGYLLCEPSAMDIMQRNHDLVEFCRTLSNSGALSVFKHCGEYITINTEQELRVAEAALASSGS